MGSIITNVTDTLQNLVSSLGTAKDKGVYDRFVYVPRDRNELDAAFRSDWLARKIVTIPASDMTRAGRQWQADKKQIEAIEAEEKRLGFQIKLNDALLYGRQYGGGAIVMGFGDIDPSQPAPKNVQKGGLKYIHAVNRYEITAASIIRDVTSPWFGEPEYYSVTTGDGLMVQIHPSRVVPFQGNRRPDRDINSEYWGDSVIEAVYDAVHNSALANSGVANLLQEAKLDVIKIPQLSKNLQTKEYAAKLSTRFSLANQLKSLVNALVIDSEEEWEQKQIDFANLPEVIREFMSVVAGAADIPATRLLGQSPGGLNATGDSDLRNYYDRISGDQNVWLTPALKRLDDAMIASALGNRPDDVWYKWASLWQQSEKEKAETDKLKAETTAIYQKTALIPVDALAKAVQNRLSEDGTYPGLDDAIEESDMELELEPLAEDPDPTDPATKPDAEKVTTQNDAAPRTLYVSRNVKNAGDIIKWAKGQGFTKTLKAEDMHVTIAFSREALDWMKTGEVWQSELRIAAGGARLVEPLGPKGAVVLLFNSSELAWRHEEIKRAGASWDWPEYQPHISITYDGKDMDLSNVEPYRGEIVLGPEIFEELAEGWDETVEEA